MISKLKKKIDLLLVYLKLFQRFKGLGNFQPLEVVDRYRDPQLQVVENYSYLYTLRYSFHIFVAFRSD